MTFIPGAIRNDTPVTFEDTDFVSGDSPVTLDINDALGRNATEFTVLNDGAGDFTVSVSEDGAVFGDEHTVRSGEVYTLEMISFDSLRLTHLSDTSYRVTAL